VIILKSLDFYRTIELLKDTNVFFFLLAISILVLQIMIATIRWKFVLDNFNYQLTFRSILSFLWIGLFFNQALPSSIGGDAMRGYYLKRKGGSIKDAAIGVLIDRLFGLIGLVLLVLLITPLLFLRLESVNFHWELILVIIGLLIILNLIIFFDSVRFNFLSSRIMSGFKSLAFESRRMLFSKHPGIILICLSVAIHILSIFAVMFLSISLALEIEFLGILLIIPLVTLFTLVPISVAGWGVREGVMVIGLGFLDVPPEQSLALSILYGLLMLVIALPGGIVWLLNGHSFNKFKLK
jgi:glycosyltransferase 2 family protein